MSEERSEPVWITEAQARIIHRESIEAFGGLTGTRDANALASALARPRQRFHYAELATLHELAAAYAFGLMRSHPFSDGNKRVAYSCVRVFLYLNGYLFNPDKADAVVTMVALAAGELDEPSFARWVEENSTPR